MKRELADWTDGMARLVVTTCSSCGASWYLPRERCATCGSTRSVEAEARGDGLCLAVTRLHTPIGRGGSFGLALVELDEGVIVMGRVHDSLSPGEPARLRFVTDDGHGILPSFGRRR